MDVRVQPSGHGRIETSKRQYILTSGCALSVMLLTLAVVLPTPHDYSGTFQGWYRAGLQPEGGFLREQEGLCTL